MMMLQESHSLENRVETIQQRLDEGVTLRDLTKEERKVIICASRKAGVSWRKIAERVGKKVAQWSTITSWARVLLRLSARFVWGNFSFLYSCTLIEVEKNAVQWYFLTSVSIQ
ncbi:MAG: hypothetical protein ACE5OZ_12715 [Candidatus Heimdallarchaeota archaeon]